MYKIKKNRILAIVLVVVMLVFGTPLDGFIALAEENSDVQVTETIPAPATEDTEAADYPVNEPGATEEDTMPTPATEDINAGEGDLLLEEPALSSDIAPADYAGDNTFLDVSKRSLMRMDEPEAAGKKVLLIEDRNPWNSTANQIELGGLTEYKKVTTATFLEEDLSEYAVVVFANDQSFSTYTNYADFKEYLEIFASIGGVIVFGACDAGWAGGQLNEAIPGNVTKTNHYETNNYVADAKHPIVTGELTGSTPLRDSDLVSMYCSHISFNENTLPPGTKVILRESTTNKPTLVEYPLGKGRVIASGLTWEHNYNYRGWDISGIMVGDFAKSLDDMFAYAIRVSNIDVDELKFLEEWRVQKNAHSIIVADGTSQNGEFSPIAGANVSIEGTEYVTDENGQVFIPDQYGLHTVEVSATGYREKKLFYFIQDRSSRIFFLDKAKEDGLPYITQVQGERNLNINYFDLRDHAINFSEGTDDFISMIVNGNWNGLEVGNYMIYQEPVTGDNGRYLTSGNGLFVFSPGKVFKPDRPVKLKMIAKNGTVSEPITIRLIIEKAAPQNGGGNNYDLVKPGIYGFDWIGNHPVKSDNPIFTNLLTKDMSISSEFIPFEISKEHNDDGTITIKAVLGFRSGEATKNILNSKKDEKKYKEESAWDTFKDEIKRFKKAGNHKAYFDKLKKKYGRDWHATKLRVTVEVETNACGFLEITIDQNGNVISADGGVIIDGSCEKVWGRTFMPPSIPIPIYYEFKAGASVEVSNDLEVYRKEEGGIGFKLNLLSTTLELPRFSIEGGAGVRGVATLGLQGNGKLVINFMPGGDSSGTLKAGGAIRLKVIFVVDYKWEFWNTSIPLWPKPQQEVRSFTINRMIPEGAEVSLTSRDYLEDTTPWNGSGAKRMALAQVAAAPMLQTLQEGVMPDALPQLQKVGDQLVMLFLRDVPERKVGNHTQLVYSVYDGGTWSEPVPVWESDTADYFFKSTVINDKLYVAWQKLKAVPTKETAEELLAEVAGNSEICFAMWNNVTKKFEGQQFITNDNKLDMYPTVAADGDTVSVLWVTNSNNDPTGASGNYTIKAADLTGAGISTIKELYTTSEFITELAASYWNNQLRVMYTIFEDNTEESNVYCLKDNTAVKVASGSESAALQCVKGVFHWQSDGVIHAYNPTTGKLAEFTAGGHSVFSSSYKYVSNGTKEAFVWEESEENAEEGKAASVIKASIYSDGKLIAPIVLLDNLNRNVSYMDVVLLENGEFAIVMNTSTYDAAEGEEATALIFAIVPPHKDIELLSASAEKAAADSNVQEVMFTIANRGDSKITSAQLDLYSGAKTFISKALALSLNPGEEITLSEFIDISTINSVTDVTVAVSVNEDSNINNNLAHITLGQVDVSMELTAYDLGNTIVFALQVSNESNTVAHSAISMVEDSLDGIVLDVKNIGEVTNRENVLYLYEINKAQVQYDENNRKVYFFKLDTLEEDWNPDDNQLFYVVFELPDESNVNPEGIMDEYVIVPITSINISSDSLKFESVQSPSVQLSAVIEPTDASLTHVLWSVENPDIAYVDPTGLVTPLRPGTTTLTAKVTNEVFDTITVTVGDKEPVVTYTITWVDGKGDTIYSEQVPSGTIPVYNSTLYGIPVKPATAQYTYTFIGWNTPPVAANAKAVYTAQFSSTLIVPGGGGNSTPSGSDSQPVINESLPRIKDSNIIGWEAVIKELGNSQKDITILMNDSTVIGKEVFAAFKDKDIRVTFIMKNKWEWIIRGDALTEPEDININEANVSINLKSEQIQESLFKGYEITGYSIFSLTEDYGYIYPWTIKAPIQKDRNDKYANLFYFDQKSKQLMFIDVAVIDGEGYAELQPYHATDYVILISDKILLDKVLQEVTVTAASKTLYINGTTGNSTKLKVNIPDIIKDLEAEDLADIAVTYKSSNIKVASVSNSGKVTARSAGKATIVTTIVINGVELNFKNTISVKKATIKLTKATSEMKAGESFTFQAKGYGFKTKDITYLSSSKSKVKINKTTGIATAMSKGTAYVIVKAGKVTIKHKVVVK